MELNVSTLQAAILMIFNTIPSISIKDMIAQLGVPADVVKTNLRSMVSARLKILIKTPENGYNINHKMSVNKRFTSQNRIIRVPNAITKTSTADRTKAQETVREDRKHTIEGNIVRIMKARKKLTHKQLMEEVTAQLMKFFTPETRQIKQRIEDLISRDYLSRDPDKRNVYHYVA